MDYRLLSIQVALEAQRRGADQKTAVLIAQEVVQHLQELEFVDLLVVLMTIENVSRSYGFPAR